MILLPLIAALGNCLTSKVYVLDTGWHGEPKGLLVVTVIVTKLPMSPLAGV